MLRRDRTRIGDRHQADAARWVGSACIAPRRDRCCAACHLRGRLCDGEVMAELGHPAGPADRPQLGRVRRRLSCRRVFAGRRIDAGEPPGAPDASLADRCDAGAAHVGARCRSAAAGQPAMVVRSGRGERADGGGDLRRARGHRTVRAVRPRAQRRRATAAHITRLPFADAGRDAGRVPRRAAEGRVLDAPDSVRVVPDRCAGRSRARRASAVLGRAVAQYRALRGRRRQRDRPRQPRVHRHGPRRDGVR
jgi:hypothetical protein